MKLRDQMEDALAAGQRKSLGLAEELSNLFPNKKKQVDMPPPSVDPEKILRHGQMPNLDAEGRVDMRQGGVVKGIAEWRLAMLAPCG